MPRIADSELKRLKDEIAVERLVESAGIELKKAGKDFAGKCPFHEDDTASRSSLLRRICGIALVAGLAVGRLIG